MADKKKDNGLETVRNKKAYHGTLFSSFEYQLFGTEVKSCARAKST